MHFCFIEMTFWDLIAWHDDYKSCGICIYVDYIPTYCLDIKVLNLKIAFNIQCICKVCNVLKQRIWIIFWTLKNCVCLVFFFKQYNITTHEVQPTKIRWNLYHMAVFRSGIDLLATIIIPSSLLAYWNFNTQNILKRRAKINIRNRSRYDSNADG